jgi:hypothetical protein
MSEEGGYRYSGRLTVRMPTSLHRELDSIMGSVGYDDE